MAPKGVGGSRPRGRPVDETRAQGHCQTHGEGCGARAPDTPGTGSPSGDAGARQRRAASVEESNPGHSQGSPPACNRHRHHHLREEEAEHGEEDRAHEASGGRSTSSALRNPRAHEEEPRARGGEPSASPCLHRHREGAAGGRRWLALRQVRRRRTRVQRLQFPSIRPRHVHPLQASAPDDIAVAIEPTTPR